MNSTIIKLIVGFIALLVWIGAIILKHYWADVDVTQIISSAQLTLVGLGVYHLSTPTELPHGSPEPAKSPEAGFVQLGLLTTLAALCVFLAGCSGLNVQWALSATYNTPAQTTATMNPGAVNK